MTPEELEKRRQRSSSETLIISKADEGFRVYSPTNVSKVYLVSGLPEVPTCTCPDFQHHRTDPEWRCKHVLAVLRRLEESRPAQTISSSAEEEFAREAKEVPEHDAEEPEETERGLPQMVIKRSVSPDGRIDALSVEFSLPVDGNSADMVEAKARGIIELQRRIIGHFTPEGRNTPAGSTQAHEPETPSEALPARMVEIGGMDGRWGRRLFITVEANGRRLRVFGSQQQLAEHISAAGFPELTHHITEGTHLDIPCRVTTRPSRDGRYVNVEKVLPAPEPQQARRRTPWYQAY